MKKIIFLLLFILPISISTKAQITNDNVDILWGKEFKDSKKNSMNDVIATDETGFYTLSSKRGGYSGNETITVSHFNNSANLLQSSEVELVKDKKEMKFEFFVQMQDQLFVFASYADKKVKKNYLYVQSMNKKSLQVNNDRKKLAEIPYQNKFFKGAGAFNYSMSRDSSKIIVFYFLPYEEYGNEKFGFHVLDSEMNELWSNNITLPYTDELFEVKTHLLDNFGNVHVLGKKYYDKLKDRRKGNPNYNYVVLSYYKGESEAREYDVAVKEKFLTEMQFEINLDHELICAGFYSNKGMSGADGCFYLKIDSESKEIVVENFMEFDLDFITQNMSDKDENKVRKKEAKGKDAEVYNYELDELIIGDDGSVFLVGEKYYVTTSTTTSSNGQTKTSYTYHYDDIIVVRIDFGGNIMWAEKVGKKQKSTNDFGFYSSYTLSVIGDKLYFIFNDHIKNINKKNENDEYEVFRKKKNSAIALVEVNPEGEQKRISLASSEDVEVMTRPKVCEQISGNELILFGQKGKTRQFAIVTFK